MQIFWDTLLCCCSMCCCVVRNGINFVATFSNQNNVQHNFMIREKKQGMRWRGEGDTEDILCVDISIDYFVRPAIDQPVLYTSVRQFSRYAPIASRRTAFFFFEYRGQFINV